MCRMSMGSEGVINQREAAEILGVSPSMVSHLTKQGVLRQRMPDGQKYGKEVLYDVEEVSALKEARDRGHTIQSVAETASQAWAAARVMQRRIEIIEKAHGLNVMTLPIDEDSVRALHIEAEDDLTRVINGAEKVNYWADRLFAICEDYIRRLVEVTRDENAWSVYLELSARMIRARDFKSSMYDPCETLAYKRLDAARVRLRIAVFVYVLQTHGKRDAFKIFPSEFQGAVHDVLTYALGNW